MAVREIIRDVLLITLLISPAASCGPVFGDLDEFFREGTLLGNRSVLDADAAIKENDPEAWRNSPPGQYRGLRRRQFTGGGWGISAAMAQFPDQEFTVICLSNNDDIEGQDETLARLSPLKHIDRCQTPTLVLHGEKDEPCPVYHGRAWHIGLKQRGIETEMAVYPREGHVLTERAHQLDLMRRMLAWFDRHLKDR